MGTFTDNELLLTLHSDHTAIVVFDGYGRGPETSVTWTLTNDMLTINTVGMKTSSDIHVLKIHVLKVVCYKSSMVLVPQPRPKSMRDFDYNPAGCFWRFVVDKKHGERLPHDAANFMRWWQYPLPTAP